jgi:hypothetical protein
MNDMVGLTKRRPHYGDRAGLASVRKVKQGSIIKMIIKGTAFLDIRCENSIVPLGRDVVSSKWESKGYPLK